MADQADTLDSLDRADWADILDLADRVDWVNTHGFVNMVGLLDPED
ncbi:MAG: hypothetical protein ACREDR_37715 [Blastocatellia bacterium]